MLQTSVSLTTLAPGQSGQLFAAELSPELGGEHAGLLRAIAIGR